MNKYRITCIGLSMNEIISQHFIENYNYSNMSKVVYDFKQYTPDTSITVLTTMSSNTPYMNKICIYIYNDMCKLVS